MSKRVTRRLSKFNQNRKGGKQEAEPCVDRRAQLCQTSYMSDSNKCSSVVYYRLQHSETQFNDTPTTRTKSRQFQPNRGRAGNDQLTHDSLATRLKANRTHWQSFQEVTCSTSMFATHTSSAAAMIQQLRDARSIARGHAGRHAAATR